MDMSQELLRWLCLEQRGGKKNWGSLCGIGFTHHLTEKLCFFFNISQHPLASICPRLRDISVRRRYSHAANRRYHDSGSTKARTITRARVLVNMCHIKFALTGRKEGSEDRNAVGINVELGSPFLQGISCLVERWGPDRELWHSALSHSGVLQLNTRTFSWTPSVCECKPPRRSHTPNAHASERTGRSARRTHTSDSGRISM